MGLGGTLALALSYFAFKDAILSRCNLLLLLDERRYLRAQKANYAQDPQIIRSLNVQLDVNFRETGMELVDRIGMDITMGFGATLVGVEKFMAIGGANPAVFMASNLLSGYVGNAPVVLYGTVNAVWSAYVWRRAHRHQKAGAKELKADIVEGILKRRIRSVKTHANLNGVTGIIVGPASLVTATLWWGYPTLVPCIISSIFCNYLWRHRIGYNRPLIRQITKVDKITLVEELQFVKSAKQIIKEAPSDSLLQLVSNPESISSIFKFMVKNDLFEDFCILLLKDTSLSTALFGTSNEELTIMEGIVLHGGLSVFNGRLGDVRLFEVK